MATSTESGEGSSNQERIRRELHRAAQEIDERYPGYREQLIEAALDCYLAEAEHDEQPMRINQRYESLIAQLAIAGASKLPLTSLSSVDEGAGQ